MARQDARDDLVKRARDYLANNAAESGADVLIAEMADELERLRRRRVWLDVLLHKRAERRGCLGGHGG